ncbi:class F sortase [Streptomyces sp. SID5785]|nr:class F sortase [Streptomyces sp. SID5785]
MRRTLAAPVLVLLAVLTACSSGAGTGVRDAGPSGTVAATGPSGAQSDAAAPAATNPGKPTRVAIDAIGVHSRLLPLGLNADGTVEVPPARQGMTAGWYTGSAVPGARGPAVLIGHNSTRYGRAVFHDLRLLREGADIAVADSRGRTRHFTVTATETVSKQTFPTRKVYGATDGPALRLVTCDGDFDAQGHPVDNLIVYAEPAGGR